MCNTTTNVRVRIAAYLSHDGNIRWKYTKIDSCISSIVEGLQMQGIDMRASCCGHGKTNGRIDLADGRILLVLREKHG